MSSSGSFKSLMEKVFDESLQTSTFVKKIIDNVSITTLETKKIADILFKLNERLNQHEKIILTLLDLHTSEKEKEKNVNYVDIKPKEKPQKPN